MVCHINEKTTVWAKHCLTWLVFKIFFELIRLQLEIRQAGGRLSKRLAVDSIIWDRQHQKLFVTQRQISLNGLQEDPHMLVVGITIWLAIGRGS